MRSSDRFQIMALRSLITQERSTESKLILIRCPRHGLRVTFMGGPETNTKSNSRVTSIKLPCGTPNHRLTDGCSRRLSDRTMARQRGNEDGNGQPTEGTPLLGTINDEQSHVLPTRKLLIVFPALALVQFTSFLDQTAVSTALPAIAAGLNIGSSISWVGASFLVASTSIQRE